MTGSGRIALAAILLVAVLAGGWFGLVAPKRAQATATDAKIAQAQARRTEALGKVARAKQLRAKTRRDEATAARLRKAVPEDEDVGRLIRQLDAIARAKDIDFRSATIGAAKAAPEPVAPEHDDVAGGDKAGADKPAAEAAGDEPGEGDSADAAAVPNIVQPPPGAAVGSAGLLTVPFQFTFDGGYLAMQRFLGAIDKQASNANGRIVVRGRLITIDGFSLAAGRDGFPKLRALVSATAYVSPAAPAVPAARASASVADPMAGAADGVGG